MNLSFAGSKEMKVSMLQTILKCYLVILLQRLQKYCIFITAFYYVFQSIDNL